MPRHPLNALLRLIAITYREKFCTYYNQNKIIFYLYGTVTHYGLTFQKVLVIIKLLLA